MELIMKKLLVVVSLLFASAAWAGDVEDGLRASLNNDYPVALAKFRLAAAQGNASAQFNLGFMFNRGRGVAQDYVEAVRWYRLAAAQGDVQAQDLLGTMFERGQGVAQDYVEAVRWYRLAAAQGDLLAQLKLGFMFDEGKGVAQDFTRAHMWFNLAAVSGDKEAVKNRDLTAARMTPQQIAQAQKLARECTARNFKNCN
jgi:hypothetical protein